MSCASRAVGKPGMALVVVEEGIAGETGKVPELAGNAGSLDAISRGVACSGFIFIDIGWRAAKHLKPSLPEQLPHREEGIACKSEQLRADPCVPVQIGNEGSSRDHVQVRGGPSPCGRRSRSISRAKRPARPSPAKGGSRSIRVTIAPPRAGSPTTERDALRGRAVLSDLAGSANFRWLKCIHRG